MWNVKLLLTARKKMPFLLWAGNFWTIFVSFTVCKSFHLKVFEMIIWKVTLCEKCTTKVFYQNREQYSQTKHTNTIWSAGAESYDTADARNWSKLAAKPFLRIPHIILTNNIRLKNDLLSVSLKSKHYNIVQNLQEDGFLNAGDFIA